MSTSKDIIKIIQSAKPKLKYYIPDKPPEELIDAIVITMILMAIGMI